MQIEILLIFEVSNNASIYLPLPQFIEGKLRLKENKEKENNVEVIK